MTTTFAMWLPTVSVLPAWTYVVLTVLATAALALVLARQVGHTRVLFTCAFVLVLSWTLGMATTYAVDPSVAFGPCGWADYWWAWWC